MCEFQKNKNKNGCRYTIDPILREVGMRLKAQQHLGLMVLVERNFPAPVLMSLSSYLSLHDLTKKGRY